MKRFRRRRTWTSAPKANANKVRRRDLEGVAIHWVGPAVPPSVYAGDEAAVRRYLEGVRRYHVYTRRWSDIAYNLAVDSAGRIYDLRGARYLSAANGDEVVNSKYLAIVALVGQDQVPTKEMLVGIRKAVVRLRRRYPWRLKEIVTHAEVRPGGTDCPGPFLISEVAAGTFRPLRLRRLLRRAGLSAAAIARLLKD